MRVQVDCYPCILSQLSELAKQAVGGEEERHALVRRLLKLVLEADRETTPPEFAAMFHSVVTELSGIDDPFRTSRTARPNSDSRSCRNCAAPPKRIRIRSRRPCGSPSAETSSTTA